MLPHTRLLPAIPQHRSSERCWLNPGPGALSLPFSALHSFHGTAPCLPGPPSREGWGAASTTAGAQHQALPSSTLAGSYHCARNGREHQALVQLESTLHNFQWTPSGCTPLLHYGFEHLLQWPPLLGTLSGAHNLPPADTHAPPLPTQGTMGQPPQLRLFPQRFDPKGNSSTDKEPCPSLTHPRPVLGQQRATRVIFLGNW